jgi:hypothetical protein
MSFWPLEAARLPPSGLLSFSSNCARRDGRKQ